MRPIYAIRKYGIIGAAKLFLIRVRRAINEFISKALRLKVVRSEYGVWMRENWSDTTFRYCVRGSYGNFLSDLILRQRKEFVFLDIGANQGLYSLIASKNRYCVRAVAFEPVLSTFKFLQENMEINRANRLIICNFAISDANKAIEIAIDKDHSGAASMHHSSDNSSYQRIEARTGDAISEYIVHGAPIFVKIDTEGHEAVVIQQLLKQPFAGDIQSIFYEVDESWVNPREIEDSLRAQGFSSFEKVRSGAHYDILATR